MVKQSQSIASLEWPVESWGKSRKLPMTDEIILNTKELSSGKSRLKITDIIQVKREDDKVRFMGKTLCFNLNIRQGHNRDDMRRLEEFVEAVEEQRMQQGGGVSSSAAYAPVNKLDKATPQRPLARIRKAVPTLSNLGAFNSSRPAAEPSSSSTFRSPPATSHHTKSANTATNEGITPRLRQSLAAAEHDESVSRLSGALGSTSSPLSVAGKTATHAPVTDWERPRSSPKRPRVPSPDRTPHAGSRTPSHMSVGRYAAGSVGRKACPMRAVNGAIYPRQSAPPSSRGDGMVSTSWSNSSSHTLGPSRGGLIVGSRGMVGSRLLSSSSTLGDGKFEGIKNLGNTCYMNAVVECVAGLPSVTDDLLSSVWFTQMADDLKRLTATASESSTSTPLIPGVYAALLRILLELKKTKHGVIDPTSFRKTMATHCKAYGSGVQQDAHEFLGDLLNTLQEELFPYARRVASAQLASSSVSALSSSRNIGKPTTEELGKGQGDKGQTSIRSFFRSSREPSEADTTKGEQDATVSEAEATILEQLLPLTRQFHAEVLKTLTCARKECGYSRSRVEAFTDFSVELLQDDGGKGKDRLKPLHVLNLMKQFFKEQMLELACEKCGHDRVRVSQCFNKLPRILVVHLKRFKLNGTTNIKLTTEVEAPVALDLSVLCDGNTLNPLVRPLGKPAPVEFSELLGVAKESRDKLDHDTASSSAADPAKGTKCAVGKARQRNESEAAEQEQADMDRWALDDDDTVSSSSPKRKGSPCADHAEGQQKRTPKAAKGMEEGGKGLIGSVEEDRQLQEAIRQSLAEAKIKEKEQALLASIEVPDDDVDAISIRPPDLPAPSVDKENMCPNRDAAVPPFSTITTATSANMKPSLMSPIDLATSSSSTAGSEQRRPPRDGPLYANYEIKCVIRHLGKSAQSGHYIADVRSGPVPPATDTTAAATKDIKATWKRFDDAVVSKLQEGDSILNSPSSLSSGYLFFYVAKEQEPQAPSITPMQVCVTIEAEAGVPTQ